jgi:hypothetical protein
MTDNIISRTLPFLKKDMIILFGKNKRKGKVVRDEEIGCCLVDFGEQGLRDLHMDTSHFSIEIVDQHKD